MPFRHISFYFSALTVFESAQLLARSVAVLLCGDPGVGRQASRLEAAWLARFGGEDAIVFPSGRAGLYALLRAFGVGAGDEVVVTGYTCEAVPLPVLHCGAIPVYADIDPQTYAIDPGKIESLFSSKTKALVIQHTYGIPAPVEKLIAIARAKGLHVIEDACLALGSQTLGRPLGSFADAAIYSFELSKTLSAGWGGLVRTNKPGLGGELRAVRSTAKPLGRFEVVRRLFQGGASGLLYGPRTLSWSRYLIWGLFKFKIFRYSASPEESVGRLAPDALAGMDGHWSVVASQLTRLDQILARSLYVAGRFRDVLEKHEWSIPQAMFTEGVRLIRFPLIVVDAPGMVSYFAASGIELGQWFDYPVAPRPSELGLFNYVEGTCPFSEEVSRHIVNLPLHSRLSDSDVANICELLDRYLTEHTDAKSAALCLASKAPL